MFSSLPPLHQRASALSEGYQLYVLWNKDIRASLGLSMEIYLILPS